MQPRSTRFNKGHKARRQILEVHNPAPNAGGPCPLHVPPDATGLQGLSAGIQWALVGSWWPVPAQLPNFPAPNSPRRAVQGAKRPGGHFFAGPKTPERTMTTKRALGQWRFAVGNRSSAVRCSQLVSPTTASLWIDITTYCMDARGGIGIFRGKK